jgi:hypothetical protein
LPLDCVGEVDGCPVNKLLRLFCVQLNLDNLGKQKISKVIHRISSL